MVHTHSTSALPNLALVTPLCGRLEDFVWQRGPTVASCLEALDELDSIFGLAAKSKTDEIRRLMKRKVIKNLSEWNVEMLKAIGWLERRAHSYHEDHRVIIEMQEATNTRCAT
jgi:hypothetical protein